MNEKDLLAVPETSFASKLAQVRAAKEAKAKAEREARELAEIQHFELVEKYSKEFNGKEGCDFAVVDFSGYGDGFVVVKLGSSVAWKAYSNSEMTEVDDDVFVCPNLVFPTIDEYRKIVARRPIHAKKVVAALADLYGLDTKSRVGK
jgi:hypothetical protein